MVEYLILNHFMRHSVSDGGNQNKHQFKTNYSMIFSIISIAELTVLVKSYSGVQSLKLGAETSCSDRLLATLATFREEY
jgi:hypothetical protein